MNYTQLMSLNPTSYGRMMNDKGQLIEFYEHPIHGEDAPILCACHELNLAACSGFYDTDDMEAEHGEYQPSFNEHGILVIG